MLARTTACGTRGVPELHAARGGQQIGAARRRAMDAHVFLCERVCYTTRPRTLAIDVMAAMERSFTCEQMLSRLSQ